MARQLKRLVCALAFAASAPSKAAAQAAACVLPPNDVVRENCLRGQPTSLWEDAESREALTLEPAGVASGEVLRVRAAARSRGAVIEIYRLGYYAASGARLLARLQAPDVDGPVDFDWRVPDDALSGIYAASLAGRKTRARARFVVRDDKNERDVLVLVGGDGCKPAFACVLAREQPLVRWLERNGFDAAYVDASDAAARPERLRAARVLVSADDDSLWPAALTAAVEQARARGVPLAALGGAGSADPPAPAGFERPLSLDAQAAAAPFWRDTQAAAPAGRGGMSFPELAGPRDAAAPPIPVFEPSDGARGAAFRARAARWVWGLDNKHLGGSGSAARREVRQATLNALVDLGAVPAALEPGLHPASAAR